MNWAPIVRELRLFGLEPTGSEGELLVTCPDCEYKTLHGFRPPNWPYAVRIARRDIAYHRRACHDQVWQWLRRVLGDP